MTNNNKNQLIIANIIIDNADKYRAHLVDLILHNWNGPKLHDFQDVLEFLEDQGECNPFDNTKQDKPKTTLASLSKLITSIPL